MFFKLKLEIEVFVHNETETLMSRGPQMLVTMSRYS